MALMKCPECQREVSDKAAACPHCGLPLTEAPASPKGKGPSAEAKAKAEERVKKGCLGCLGLGVVFVVVLALFSSDDDDLSQALADNSSMASVQCDNFVRSRLRSPSTADFPFLDRNITSLGSNTFLVTSYVDAQNAFGATVRTQFACQIRFRGGDEADQRNWELVDLQMN